jgi:hypothetical protein
LKKDGGKKFGADNNAANDSSGLNFLATSGRTARGISDRIEIDAPTDQQASDEKLQPFSFALLPE